MITTHGNIKLENDEPVRLKVPEAMKITKVAVAPLGVCNVTTQDQIDSLSKYIARFFEQFSEEDLDDKVSYAMSFIKSFQSNVKTKVKSDLKTKKDEQMEEFIRYGDKRQTVYIYTSGQELLDKRYSRSREENLERAFDYKINMLNVRGKPDLIHYMVTGKVGQITRSDTRDEGISIDLSDIVDFVKEQGVKHLVVFDLSCSTIPGLEPRDIRAKRRRLEIEGVSGGRKKTKSRKTRRSKSYSKWKHSSRFSRSTLKLRRS